MVYQPGFRGAGRREFTFIGSATNNDTSINLTSLSAGAIAAGDFCVVCNEARTTDTGGNSIPTTVVPSGFTSGQNTSLNGGAALSDLRAIVSAKKLTGSETTLTGMDAALEKDWIALVFRPSVAFSAFAWTLGGAETEQTGNPASISIPASAGGAGPVISIGQMSGSSTLVITSVSPSMTKVDGAMAGHAAHYRIDNTSPQDTTYNMGDSGNGNVAQGGYYTFT